MADARDTGGLVSVVLPTRDRPDSVQRAVESALAQSVRDLELIIVDDGSTDDTSDVLARLAGGDPRIRVCRLERRVGAAAARNHGIERACGEYVAFIDDDAQWRPNKLDCQLRLLGAAPDAALAYCPFVYVDPDGAERIVGSRAAVGGRARKALLRENFIDTSCVLIRREPLLEAGGFDERLPRLQDWDLWLRLAERTEFVFDPEPLVRTRFTPGGISTRSTALVEACRYLAAKYSDRLGNEERALWLNTLGHTLMTGGAPGVGRRFLWRAFRAGPLSSRRAIFALVSLLGPEIYNALVRIRARVAR